MVLAQMSSRDPYVNIQSGDNKWTYIAAESSESS